MFCLYRALAPLLHVVVCTDVSKPEGPGLISGWLLSVCEFACSPHVCLGSLWVPWLPPTVQRYACLTKLPIAVDVSVWKCVSKHQSCDEQLICFQGVSSPRVMYMDLSSFGYYY